MTKITGNLILDSLKKNSVRYNDPAEDAGLPSPYIGAAAMRKAGLDPAKPPRKARYTIEFDEE